MRSGGLPGRLLDLARAGAVRLHISDEIMGEVLRVLPEKFQYSPEMLRETEEKLASITQLAAACTAPAMQLALFDALHDDRRPSSERTAAERYHQPGLFETHAGATQGPGTSHAKFITK